MPAFLTLITMKFECFYRLFRHINNKVNHQSFRLIEQKKKKNFKNHLDVMWSKNNFFHNTGHSLIVNIF